MVSGAERHEPNTSDAISSINLDNISRVLVDEYMRTSFDEIIEGRLVSGTFSFSDGGYGEYLYEIDGNLRKLIISSCRCKVSANGFVLIKSNSSSK